jgi:hypothetical protein
MPDGAAEVAELQVEQKIACDPDGASLIGGSTRSQISEWAGEPKIA